MIFTNCFNPRVRCSWNVYLFERTAEHVSDCFVDYCVLCFLAAIYQYRKWRLEKEWFSTRITFSWYGIVVKKCNDSSGVCTRWIRRVRERFMVGTSVLWYGPRDHQTSRNSHIIYSGIFKGNAYVPQFLTIKRLKAWFRDACAETDLFHSGW
jgi:hypothetical protein